ncbi:lipopolysaccharide biosynthesis protein [Rufibacter latericius]|uniref:Lipopolysaccharide biosynthesis protein n=1 Tax=Rufibacter latericius TaxID=2487040 RepID=A0A3M9MJ69_9BACT|nr:lipopolysaccharide biosynthesis protein [Rufibacter latericius]RNI25602.1 lipopolysaccharide biosynthesis protein [Rufibacter latericius]
MADHSGKTFFKGTIWAIIDNFFRQAITLSVFVVLARLLEPEVFGLLSFSFVFVNIFVAVINDGIVTAIVRKENPEEVDYNTGFWLCLGCSIPAFLFLFFTAGFFEDLTDSKGLAIVMRATSFIILTTGLSSIHEVWLRRRMDFKTIAIRSIISVGLGGLVGVYLAMQGFGVTSVLAQQLTTAITQLILLWFTTTWRPGLNVSKTSLKEILNFSKYIALTNLSNAANQNSDVFFVTYFLGPVSTGIYTTGKRISSTLNTVISTALLRVSLPAFSKLQNDEAGLAKIYLQSTTLTAMVTAPIFAGIAMLSKDITLLILGEKWLASVPIMQVVTIIGFLTSIGYYNQSTMVAKNKPQWQTRLTLLYAISNVTAFLIFTRFGLLATALAFAGRAILLYPVSVWCALQLTGVNWGKYVKALLPALLSAFLMVLVLAQAATYLVSTPLILRLIILVALGGATYCSLLYLFMPGAYRKYMVETVQVKVLKQEKVYN